MNAERLLELYEQISEAPDAVLRLRRFVLELAVRGKIVEQCDSNVSADALVRDVFLAKTKAGIKQTLKDIDPSEVPFELPRGWAWARLGEICLQTGSGSTPRGGKTAYVNEGAIFLRSQNVYDDGLRLNDVVFIPPETHAKMARTSVMQNDLLLNITGGSIGRCSVITDEIGPTNISQHVSIIRCALGGYEKYLHLVVRSPYFQSFIFGEQNGAGREGLPKKKMDLIPVPIPPDQEQYDIVAKVDELMVLCDQLEQARKAREETRDRLTVASLARLTVFETLKAEPADTGTAAGSSMMKDAKSDFQDHANFALNAFPALTSRPDQIKTLRQTILNLAVRGKLAISDGGSSEQVGKYRKLQNGYAFKSGWFAKSGLRLLRNANIGHGEIRWTDTVYLPKEMADEYERFQLNEGDIVLTLDRPFIVTGTKVARITDTDVPSLLLQRVGRFVEVHDGLSDDYLFLWINSPHFNDQIDPGRSNGVPHISSKQVEAAAIFVPPIAEQHRIVAEVDALMALCDRLEAALTKSETTRTRLLEALLHEALEPASDALEAAE
jgi:type I restriction enzyme S subunit